MSSTYIVEIGIFGNYREVVPTSPSKGFLTPEVVHVLATTSISTSSQKKVFKRGIKLTRP